MRRIVSVYGEMNEDIPLRKLEKRTNIIEEIILTESGFVYDMETLQELFCLPIQQHFPDLFATSGLSLLYDTLEEMLVHQRKLLHNLQQVKFWNSWFLRKNNFVFLETIDSFVFFWKQFWHTDDVYFLLTLF